MKKTLVIFSLFPLLFFANSGHAYSETTTLSPDGGMEIQIIYHDSDHPSNLVVDGII